MRDLATTNDRNLKEVVDNITTIFADFPDEFLMVVRTRLTASLTSPKVHDERR